MKIANVRANSWSRLVAWVVGGLFVAGFFVDPIGTWTGPILGLWFVGTQRVWRGFLWMLAFAFIPSILMEWRRFPIAGLEAAGAYLAWTFLAAVLSVLPFSFHRIVSPRLKGLLSTLPLPLAVVVLHILAGPRLHVEMTSRSGVQTFLIFWFAAAVVWMWNNEFRAGRIGRGAGVFAAIFVLFEGALVFSHFEGDRLGEIGRLDPIIAWSCLGAAAALSLWAALRRGEQESWVERPETVALLRSPVSGERLCVIREGRHEVLASGTGERFPIRDGMPDFLRAEDLTGDNGKYNHLYETIGGFYDDTQRVACALRGVDRDSYFVDYMRLLEVKPGDSVLETSVGTGLNFKYLPRGVKLSGLDLSPEMLAGCQTNMGRWGMEADLYLGNAEALPFADSSFDVVFHVGGISFFNDKGKAIREMIRVAKPGSLLLIEDETEDYAKSTYERIPITSAYFKDRKEEITVPIDLVPAEMEEIRLEMLKDGKFFAITFRKPVERVGVKAAS